MGKIKMRFLTIALIAITLTLFTQGTLAYYSTAGVATNVVTSGSIKLKIHETTGNGAPFPSEGYFIKPGDIVSKRVRIENLCDHPFYLRVKILYDVNSQELSSEDCFKLNIDDTTWKYKDGWYYYNGVVEPESFTPYVFSKVEIVGDKMDNAYLGKTLTLSVLAEGVQSENNPIVNGDVSTAAGWPQGSSNP